MIVGGVVNKLMHAKWGRCSSDCWYSLFVMFSMVDVNWVVTVLCSEICSVGRMFEELLFLMLLFEICFVGMRRITRHRENKRGLWWVVWRMET